MPSFISYRSLTALAPWVLALLALAPQGAPARAQGTAAASDAGAAPLTVPLPAATDYASRVAREVDEYLDKVVLALQGASREGPGGFDERRPRMAGPGGRLLPVVYTERLTDSLISHPRGLEILTRDDVANSLHGRHAIARDGRIVVALANPGGASAIGVAIPAADIAPRLPGAAAAGGVLLFAPDGRPFAANGTLSAEQLEVFAQFLPQKPPNLVVAETPFSVAVSGRVDLLVVARMAASQAAPEPQLPSPLFLEPRIELAPEPASPTGDLAGRLAIALPLALGALGGLLILVGRRRRRQELRDAGADAALSDIEGVDYLDALADGKAAGDFEIDGEDAFLPRFAAPPEFVEGVGEVRALELPPASPEPAAAGPQGTPEEPRAQMLGEEGAPGSMEAPETEAAAPDAEAAAPEAEAAAPEAEAAALETQATAPEAETATPEAAAPASVDLPEVPAEPAVRPEAGTQQPEPPAQAVEPEEVDQLIADLMESTALEAEQRDEQEAAARAAAEERSRLAGEERAALRDRAARLKERLSERPEVPRAPDKSEPPASLPGKPREIVHIGRAGGIKESPGSLQSDRVEAGHPPAEGGDTLRRHKTVNPGDVLITKGEAQSLVEKEAERIFGRMQALTRDVEIRTAEALAVHRETFRELLEQFEALQENRERDLATMHDLKNDLANEVTAATLKLRQAEAKATDGMLRLKDQMDNLTRKLEGWAADSRIAEERLVGALETIREGWENQLEAHAELRKEVQRLTELQQDISRKQDAAADREAAERRSCIDQLAFEIKTVQLATENDFSVMASRLDELKAAVSTLVGRLERAEGTQTQALDAVYRKIEAGEAVEALKSRVARDLDDLKVRLDKGETTAAEFRGLLEVMQSDLREESGRILSQVIHEVEKGIATATQGSVAYQNQIDGLKEESSRLSQRQHQIVQLMASLHTALGKADARASEEVERLKAQNNELQQMMLSMMRTAPRPPGPPQAAGQPGPAPQRRTPPLGPDGRPVGPTPGQPPARPPQAEPAPRPAQAAGPESAGDEEDFETGPDARPIDLWSRLLGRVDESSSARKRRSK